MKTKISSFSVILLFFCLSLIGLALMPLLPVKLFPSKTLPVISVSFGMQNSAPRVVEMEATSKLEAMLCRIKGIEGISSMSGNNSGYITLRFDKHTDKDAARFEVSTAIRQCWPSLPAAMSYPTISQSRADNQASRAFMAYTIVAPSNPIIIQNYAENNIKPKLAQLKGIDRIEISGATPMEWRLEYDYRQLESLGLQVYDLQEAISNWLQTEYLGTASIEGSGQEKQWIRVALMPEYEGEKTFDPAKIDIKNIDGKIISLDKLVKVSHLEQESSSYYRINGLNSIYMTVYSEDDANQIDLSRRVKDRLETIKTAFPGGYELHLEYDNTEDIQKELSKVYFRSGLTLIILLLFVLLIYRNPKYLLLIFLTLFMNIAVAIIFYYLAKLDIQVYSLAGITISLTLVIDNTIVMSDQIIHRHNRLAFLAILAATATTIASLSIIFFMSEQIRLNLQDFAIVIIINLTVSLFVALFLVPALIERLKMEKPQGIKIRHAQRFARLTAVVKTRFNRFYAALCRFVWKRRVIACLLIILIFGLPVFNLPEKIENQHPNLSGLYNKTLGSTFYREKIKPYSDIALGGTLRLFVQKVYEGSYFSNERSQTMIGIAATLPNGSTVEQMNNLVQRMESFISSFPEVGSFQTNVSSRRASIYIYFTKESEKTAFPYLLKSELITRSTQLGGGSWSVYGLGDGFSNDVREQAGNYRVTMRGYNYDELWELAEQFKTRLENHRRINNVSINYQFNWYKDDYDEYVFELDKQRLAEENIYPSQLFSTLRPMFGQATGVGAIAGEYGMENIYLKSRQSKEYDVWSIKYVPGRISREKEWKLDGVAELKKTQSPQNIAKENQQYVLCLQYEYIGASEQGRKVLERNIEEFRSGLPMGYTIESENQYYYWDKKDNSQYWLLALIFVIIYFMSSILFNSLRQPFAVICVIPISFIGIFLTFYLFHLNFDQGGFASFVLLSGLSVNANIYIMNEYNNIRNKLNITPLRAYIKAWNVKISPIFLTIISTILGFIPFMVGQGREAFWFPLAAGTIGGLIISLLGSFLFLPLFMGVGKR
ncbi:MAG: efflux RND transporter permease subunit [Dysgonamonadaceae bacterium]|jgi:multidrug efflux pump subunit AcrB|nr:efflux RND transporter permease subunit [Dysgonamonadaceae bacterium]